MKPEVWIGVMLAVCVVADVVWVACLAIDFWRGSGRDEHAER
jgi:hypothetical protein